MFPALVYYLVLIDTHSVPTAILLIKTHGKYLKLKKINRECAVTLPLRKTKLSILVMLNNVVI